MLLLANGRHAGALSLVCLSSCCLVSILSKSFERVDLSAGIWPALNEARLLIHLPGSLRYDQLYPNGLCSRQAGERASDHRARAESTNGRHPTDVAQIVTPDGIPTDYLDGGERMKQEAARRSVGLPRAERLQPAINRLSCNCFCTNSGKHGHT